METPDDGLERIREAMEHHRKRHETEMLEAAERSLAEVDAGDCPPPLSWHPYYRGKTWLLDWLNGKSGLPERDIVLPVPERLTLFAEPDPLELAPMRTIRMRKDRAWGLAPWTERPFHYEWYVGTDELGRHIAGESRIVYETRL